VVGPDPGSKVCSSPWRQPINPTPTTTTHPKNVDNQFQSVFGRVLCLCDAVDWRWRQPRRQSIPILGSRPGHPTPLTRRPAAAGWSRVPRFGPLAPGERNCDALCQVMRMGPNTLQPTAPGDGMDPILPPTHRARVRAWARLFAGGQCHVRTWDPHDPSTYPCRPQPGTRCPHRSRRLNGYR
jgi:hypothetical protein